eukprot:CAMPEP_0113845282 /NCGR_PEP_ID=MMETSP0372-20130328/669_1 /TAXON_ID=340204 /ORGANISM="Lankesteria abbotti" /LENGTH=195 /DNA_ID=CAMNT_0000814305 /DNA_START=23 /DNA_END=610 /DNA_ORIENTATION=- /assembly_acc=CAM_ASM_000359
MTFEEETCVCEQTVAISDCGPSSPSGKSGLAVVGCVMQNVKIRCSPDIEVAIGPMTCADYADVRELIPGVSQCTTTFAEDDVNALLAIPTYHPVCVRLVPSNGNSKDSTLVGFAELYRLPHLGRGFDARLERVLIIEDYRGMGLATKLCNYMIEQAKVLGCGRVDLTVEAENAKHVYGNKLHFKEVDTTVMRRKF